MTTILSRAVSQYQSGLLILYQKILLKLSRKGNLLVSIIWKLKDSINLRPDYWSKDSNIIIRTWSHSFHLLALPSKFQAYTVFSQQLQSPKHASFSIVSIKHSQLTDMCSDWKCAHLWTITMARRMAFIDWWGLPQSCAHLCVKAGHP